MPSEAVDDAYETGTPMPTDEVPALAAYDVDADAVAEAIVARLLAGRTIRLPKP